MNYIPISELFHLQNTNLPTQLDFIQVKYKGITFDIYGVLHGLIGGTNQQYRDVVNSTIKNSVGLKFCEKSMKSMYKGLDHELDDWVQMPFNDVRRLTSSLLMSPLDIWRTCKALAIETFRKRDKFGRYQVCRIQDIGGSMAFHLLHPSERRLLAGFLPPEEYLKENILRRESKSKLAAPCFPDEDWSWLNLIEPHANIPLRSIHMIETAVLLCKEKNVDHASLFIGEIHNSDIAWYVQRGNTSDWMESYIAKVVGEAESFYNSKSKLTRRWKYFAGAALGAAIPIFCILAIIIAIQSCLKPY